MPTKVSTKYHLPFLSGVLILLVAAVVIAIWKRTDSQPNAANASTNFYVDQFQFNNTVEAVVTSKKPAFLAVYRYVPSKRSEYLVSSRWIPGELVKVSSLIPPGEGQTIVLSLPENITHEAGEFFEAHLCFDDGDGVFDEAYDEPLMEGMESYRQRFNLAGSSTTQPYWEPAAYMSDKYGFEVRYPKGWRYDDQDGCGENCIGFIDSHSQDWNAIIVIHDSPYPEVKKALIKGINPQIEVIDVEQDSIINGIPWTYLKLQEGHTRLIDGHFTERQGRTYELRVTDPMLFTFKFTNS